MLCESLKYAMLLGARSRLVEVPDRCWALLSWLHDPSYIIYGKIA